MLELLGNSEYSDSFDNSVNDSENSTAENTEYTAENRRYLKRLEEEFLQDLQTGYFIKDFLQTVMFNSFNTFLTLYCIQIGIGLVLSCIAGFSIGAIPALKNIGDNFRIPIESENKAVVTNGNFVKGLFQLVLAGTLTFNAVTEWRSVLWMAKESHSYFMQQVDAYEKPGKYTFGIDPSLAWSLCTVGGFIGCLIVVKFLQRRD